MSIYSRRYERYEGPLESASSRWLVIVETELRRLYREKWVRRLVILAWTPVLFQAARMYLILVAGQLDEPPREVYLSLFRAEAWFVAMMLAAFGSGIIARDVSNRALTLYFTRPVNADQYLLGKLASVLTCVLAVTLLPGLLLALAQLMMSNSASWTEFASVAARVTGASLIGGMLVSTLILLLSSLGTSARYVGVTWLALFVFLAIGRGILVGILGPIPALDLMSIERLFVATAEYLITGDTDQLRAMVASLLLSAFFLVALRVRIRALERAFS